MALKQIIGRKERSQKGPETLSLLPVNQKRNPVRFFVHIVTQHEFKITIE